MLYGSMPPEKSFSKRYKIFKDDMLKIINGIVPVRMLEYITNFSSSVLQISTRIFAKSTYWGKIVILQFHARMFEKKETN